MKKQGRNKAEKETKARDLRKSWAASVSRKDVNISRRFLLRNDVNYSCRLIKRHKSIHF